MKRTSLVTISSPKSETWLFDEMNKIAERERVTFSKVCRRAFKEFIQRHGKGNPQTPLFPEPEPKYDNPMLESRRDLLADMLADVRSHPAQPVIVFIADWGRVHGLKEETVQDYVKQLGHAGKVKIRGGKLYPC